MAADEGEPLQRWEGYADYEKVSVDIAESINKAVRAYSHIDSIHAEGAPMQPGMAARARSRILAAAIQLRTEMEDDKEVDEFYQEALGRWEGEDGYITRLSSISLREQCPGWLFQFVTDIRRAGWKLGYLQAGRRNVAEKQVDDDTQQVRDMFE